MRARAGAHMCVHACVYAGADAGACVACINSEIKKSINDNYCMSQNMRDSNKEIHLDDLNLDAISDAIASIGEDALEVMRLDDAGELQKALDASSEQMDATHPSAWVAGLTHSLNERYNPETAEGFTNCVTHGMLLRDSIPAANFHEIARDTVLRHFPDADPDMVMDVILENRKLNHDDNAIIRFKDAGERERKWYVANRSEFIEIELSNRSRLLRELNARRERRELTPHVETRSSVIHRLEHHDPFAKLVWGLMHRDEGVRHNVAAFLHAYFRLSGEKKTKDALADVKERFIRECDLYLKFRDSLIYRNQWIGFVSHFQEIYK